MKFALTFITLVTWALWLGGTIAVFVFGLHFRAALSEGSFHDAAHAMFQSFNQYELILAGVLLCLSGLLVVTFPSKPLVLLLGCVVLCGGMTVTAALGLTPAMESLRDQGKTNTTEFKKLHGKYMIATSMQAGMLLLSGVVLLAELNAPRRLPVDHEVNEPGEATYSKRAGLSQRV